MNLLSWAKTHEREMTDHDVALRLLWSPEMTEVDDTGEFVIPDETVAWVGSVLGLTDTETHNPESPQHRNTVFA